MLSDELKQNLDTWFDRRIKELGNLKKLHYSLLGLKKTEYPEWQGMIDDLIFTYSEIGGVLVDGEGKISCIPREIKSDMVSFLRRKASDYPDAGVLATLIHERVPSSSVGGRVSKPWLRRKGYTKADLVWKEGIQQIGVGAAQVVLPKKKVYKGLELE